MRRNTKIFVRLIYKDGTEELREINLNVPFETIKGNMLVLNDDLDLINKADK
jgi:hypothetical protein